MQSDIDEDALDYLSRARDRAAAARRGIKP